MAAIVVVAAMVGLLGLWRWAPERSLTLYWLGGAMSAMLLGLIFWERRYRWSALVIYILFVVGRVMLYDLRNLELVPRLRCGAGDNMVAATGDRVVVNDDEAFVPVKDDELPLKKRGQ